MSFGGWLIRLGRTSTLPVRSAPDGAFFSPKTPKTPTYSCTWDAFRKPSYLGYEPVF